MYSSTPLFAALSKLTIKVGAPTVSTLRVLDAEQIAQVSGGTSPTTAPTTASTPTKGW